MMFWDFRHLIAKDEKIAYRSERETALEYELLKDKERAHLNAVVELESWIQYIH